MGQITMSLGIVAWQPPEDTAQLLRRADDAMYQAKPKGRNQVVAAF